MLQLRSVSKDSTQVLFDRLQEAHQLICELARIILPGPGEFRSVWEITHQVLDDHARHGKAA
jgi:hypothetical protein